MRKKMSRRNFVQTTALSSTAALMAGCINESQVVENSEEFRLNKDPLKLGVMTYTLAEHWDIDTIIKNLTETGYQSVELRTTHAHGIEVSLSAAERAEVKKKFEDSALEEISYASAFQYHFADQTEVKKHIEGTKECVLLAEDIGATSIRVFPNALVEGIPEDQTLQQIAKALAEVGKFGYDHGVKIKVCVHGNKTARVPIIKKIIDYSESPHVYVNWNCNLSDTEGEGLEYNFNSIKDRIISLHMHELWTADYPYRQLFKLLADSGFTGYCNAEISGNKEDPIRLMRYYRALFLALQNAY